MHILVIGAGSWGTALAILLAKNSHQVELWGKDTQALQAIADLRINQAYLPNISLPENLTIVFDLLTSLKKADQIVIATPSHALRNILQMIIDAGVLTPKLILACKGIDPISGSFGHELVTQLLPQASFAVLSGPSFALEVAKGLPTAVTLASEDKNFGQQLVSVFSASYFRPYYAHDVIGVEVGGAVKNIIAIAVGISDGLGYGANARAALITRGMAEIVRLGIHLGGQPETFLGLAGMGDLILTCTDNQSRNRRFGLAIGQGASTEAALASIGQVVEGLQNTKYIYTLAKKLAIEMPITEQVYQILYQQLACQQAVKTLFARDTKAEFVKR